jgi:hypothetical protein
MAKSNAELQVEKRRNEKELLKRIGGQKRNWIMSKALLDAMDVLCKRYEFEEWQEAASTILINFAAATPEQVAPFATLSRHEFAITEKQSRQLEEFAKTGVESRLSPLGGSKR